MEWYLMVWKKYSEFDGRARRTEYWMFTLFNFLAILALCAVGGVGIAMSQDNGWVLFIPLGIYGLASLLPSLAVATRRFHDIGKSGWILFLLIVLGVIPVVGFITAIVQLVFLCTDSEPGPNLYGPNPKFPEQAAGVIAGYPGFSPVGFPQPPPLPPQPHAGESGYGLCRSCGARLENGSSFCTKCGATV